MRIVVLFAKVLLIISSCTKMEENKMFKIRIPISKNINIQKIDPINIRLVEDYLILENIYSPLISFDGNEITYLLADEIKWIGNDVLIKMKNGLLDSQGNQITCKDLYKSLERMFKIKNPSHVKLTEMTISNDFNTSVQLKNDENVVILKMKKKFHFFIPMLAQIDFAVIPSNSLDENLNIKTLLTTSGPFYLDLESGFKMKKNLNYIKKSNYADQIELIAVSKIEDTEIDKFDLIPSFFPLQNEINLSNNFKIHKTIPMKVWKLVFTPNGLTSFDKEQRYYISNLIWNKSINVFKDKVLTAQIFQNDSVFSLSQDEVSKIKSQYLKKQKPIKQTIKIGVSVSRLDHYRNILQDENISINGFSTLDELNNFDLVLMNQDVGYEESAAFISYSLQSPFFGVDKVDANMFLKKYLDEDDKQKRIEVIKDISRYIFERATIIPLYFEEYVTRYKRNLMLENSKNTANLQFWKVFRAE
jgi:hypothetical protein